MKRKNLVLTIKLLVISGLTILEAIEKTSEMTGVSQTVLRKLIPDKYK